MSPGGHTVTVAVPGRQPQDAQEEAETDARRRRQTGDQSCSLRKPGDGTRMSPGGQFRLSVVPGEQPQDVQEEAESDQRRRRKYRSDQSKTRTHVAKVDNDYASQKKKGKKRADESDIQSKIEDRTYMSTRSSIV